MKILMTGATGYLGSHLLKSLVNEGHEIIVVKRSTSNLKRIQSLLEHCRVFDIDNIEIEDLFCQSNYDLVLHTATCQGRGQVSDIDVIETNLCLFTKILYYAQKYNIKKFINIDTALPILTNAYSLTKKQFVQWGKYYAENKKFSL